MPRKMLNYCQDKGFKGTVVNRALPSSEKKNTKCQNKKKHIFLGEFENCCMGLHTNNVLYSIC